MSESKQELFISYKREPASIQLAREMKMLIEMHFPFLNVMLDEKEIRTGASIKDFMGRLSKGNYVIFLISPAYLKSDWCMYELASTADYDDFKDRIFHVRFPNVEISTSNDVMRISEYWQERWTDLKMRMEKVKQVKTSHLATEFDEELNLTEVIISGGSRALLHLRQTIGLTASEKGDIDFEELLRFMDGWIRLPDRIEPAKPQFPPPIQQLLDDMLPIPATTTITLEIAAYQLGRTPVTQAQWQAVMGTNPSHFQSADAPVESVSWHDCQAFLTQLNALTGRQFRLPTEAEWVHAASATMTPAPPLATIAVFDQNAHWQSQPVGTRPGNAFGLQDMLGNVFEWCQDLDTAADASQEDVRVIKGGAWLSHAADLDPRTQHTELATTHHPAIGLRLAHNA